MRVAPRSEPVAVVTELALEERTDHLRERWLEHALCHARNAQRALIAIRCGDLYSAYRVG